MSIVDDLLAHPGLYLGVDRFLDSEVSAAARIDVRPLPGRAGVTLDYEVIDPDSGDRPLGHKEHTVLARTHAGGAVMVIGHTHSESVTILHETDPGQFELGSEASPFPMKISISCPEPGVMRHSWWYGQPGAEATERDIAELRRVEQAG